MGFGICDRFILDVEREPGADSVRAEGPAGLIKSHLAANAALLDVTV